jgi:hypothetical protein
VIVGADALHDHGRAVDVVAPHRQDRLVGVRGVPRLGGSQVGELDDDDGAGPGAFLHVYLSAVHDEASAEGFERVLDAFDVLEHLVVDLRGAEVGKRVGRHRLTRFSMGCAMPRR